MKKLLFTAAIFVASFSTFAQVGIGTTDPKGALDVVSTNSAVVFPRVAAADVTSPINGMIIYDTTINCFNFFENGAWTSCIDATPTATLSIGGGNTITFMSHNLGADQSLDPRTLVKGLNGDYYQWGRNAPAADVDNLIGVWGSQGGNSNNGNWTPTAKGPEDPCPTGFRVPSQAEWTAVNANNTASRTGTFTNSPTNFSAALHYGPDANTKSLTLPAAGRYRTNGVLNNRGSNGYYWSSTENGSPAYNLTFNSSNVIPANNLNRNYGFSVRCIAE
jgi:uncharacterized protein (TIGR02145 family)